MKIQQLLPVLGSDILTPLVESASGASAEQDLLFHETKGLVARGQRTATGFVVFEGSQAVLQERPSAAERHPFVPRSRQELLSTGALVADGNLLRFTRNTEFPSPSAAAGVLQGGGANGLTSWRNAAGRTLKELEGG